MRQFNVKNNIAIFILLGLIACAQTYWLLAWDKSAFGFLTVIVVLLTLDLYAATILNIHVLVPRLLLRGRYFAYAFSLLSFAIIGIGIDIFSEYRMVARYHVQPGESWYIGNGYWAFFYMPSAIVAYFISFAGTGILFFLHLWNRSDRRLNDLKEQSTRNELEKVRTQIDSESLFNTLDKAADNVVLFPAEVSALLMDLSKSLRMQLYESRQKQAAAPQEPPVQTFNLSSPALDFLTEKRYHLRRHLLMILWFAMIVIPNNSHDSILSILIAMGAPLATYVVMIYFNVYVLIPKLMMQGKKIIYFVVTCLLFLASILFLVSLHAVDIDVINNIHPWFPTFFIVATAFKLSFPILGVCAACLFQYWVRNQRRITELETATMLSELEQLQNQVNPHFLFNMLNNVLVLTKTDPDKAAVVLRELSDMLKYQFRGFTKQRIRLGDDIHFLTDYLNLEKLRRDNFEFSITADKSVEALSLPPLLFIPFVENAVKHGNDNHHLSFVRLRYELKNDTLHFECINSKPIRPMRKDGIGGLGLPNVRRRLDLLYGDRYQLEITENDTTYEVKLRIITRYELRGKHKN